MRLSRGVRTLAAIVSLAVATAPAAHASAIREGGGGLPPASHTSQVARAHRDSGSAEWTLIAVAGGAVVLAGAGVGGSRVHNRRRSSTSGVEAARIS